MQKGHKWRHWWEGWCRKKRSANIVNRAWREREHVKDRERERAGRRSLPSGKQHLSLRSAPPLFFPLGISPTLQSPAFSSPDFSQTLPRYGRFVCACARVFACAKFVRFEACARARAVRVLDTRSVLSVCLSPSSPLRAAAAAAEVGVRTLWPSLAHSSSVSPSSQQRQGGYGWTAFTSTHRGGFGLHRSVCCCVVSVCSSATPRSWIQPCGCVLHYRLYRQRSAGEKVDG